MPEKAWALSKHGDEPPDDRSRKRLRLQSDQLATTFLEEGMSLMNRLEHMIETAVE